MKEHAPAIDFNNLGQHFICADCMDGMKQVPDKFFDLAIVDPPYGIGEDGSKNATRDKLATATAYKPFYGNDKSAPDQTYFEQVFRISKNQIIFGANHFISKIPFDSSCWIVWDKQNGETDFADCELAWTSFKRAVRIFRFTWSGMRQGDMKNREKRIHPTQKPVKLYQWLLKHFAKAGDKILDTHVGSGSSLIAFHRGGFDFIGFEIDEDYYAGAMERLNIEKLQGDLFMNSKTFA